MQVDTRRHHFIYEHTFIAMPLGFRINGLNNLRIVRRRQRRINFHFTTRMGCRENTKTLRQFNKVIIIINSKLNTYINNNKL